MTKLGKQLIISANQGIDIVKNMNKPPSIYFVWVPGLKGPTCELYYDNLEQNKDSHGKDKKKILQQHELVPEYKDLKLNQLALIFPYKGE